ncbi:unnamed protein product [Peronospora belbahrii]|uniref:RING-type E3 ubiquitin transferase (cysteine targeting) n=1 Tax=Peronospora belbahrii TaxID=622444 RepID=A0AAU9KXX3_9STRA|nr:unnamed protein product [Peronospora belbahrii]CAH0516767.1 unnamed protein product [Peronospora belbahrii]
MQPPHVETAKAALQESLSSTFSSTPENDHSLRVPYNSLRSPSNNLRVNKWDALILDSEILGLLKTPLKGMFSMFEPSFVTRFDAEIDATLQTLLFAFTTGLRRPTPGMKLENVQYAPHVLTGRRIGALFMLSIGVPFVWKRLFRYLSSGQWTVRGVPIGGDTSDNDVSYRERVLVMMKRLETLVLTLQLVNLLIFLQKGTYRSLPERCLGMKLESIAPSTAPRLINFEYMTRQLLWNGLMDFGNFFLPLLTWSCLRTSAALQGKLPTAASNRSSQCCLCGISPPQTPYITSCKHVYCYYCLQTAVAMDDDYPCVACGIKFVSSQQLRM